MFSYISEYKRYVEITGFKNINYAAAHKLLKAGLSGKTIDIQFFDAELIAGIKPESTTIAAVIIGKEPKPVKEALNEITASLGGSLDETVLEISKAKEAKIMEAYDISEVQIGVVDHANRERAIANLVIEQVALLATQL